LGAGIELTGVGIKGMALALQKAGLAEAQALNALVLGKGMIRFGGVTSALAGIVEGVQSGFAASRTGKRGDFAARNYHYVAMSLSIASAGVAGYVAYFGLGSLLGPLGWAIAFGLLAYTTSEYAKRKQSTLIEQWARRCYFGKHDETPPIWWNTAKTLPSVPVHANSSIGITRSGEASADMDVAIGALNAALLGIVADFDFYFRPRLALTPMDGTGMQWGTTLEYSVEFPSWWPEHSGYAMSVALHSYLPEQIVIAEQHNALAIETVSASPKRPGFCIDSAASQRPTSERPVIAGCLLLDIAEADIESATLRIKYWPNIQDKEGYAEITIAASR